MPELGDENFREIPAYSYRVLYEVLPGDEVVGRKRRSMLSGVALPLRQSYALERFNASTMSPFNASILLIPG